LVTVEVTCIDLFCSTVAVQCVDLLVMHASESWSSCGIV